MVGKRRKKWLGWFGVPVLAFAALGLVMAPLLAGVSGCITNTTTAPDGTVTVVEEPHPIAVQAAQMALAYLEAEITQALQEQPEDPDELPAWAEQFDALMERREEALDTLVQLGAISREYRDAAAMALPVDAVLEVPGETE